MGNISRILNYCKSRNALDWSIVGYAMLLLATEVAPKSYRQTGGARLGTWQYYGDITGTPISTNY
ncbi:hypothetical protein BM1_08049 [Bipolaris maydis]|nr:hypothetical protein BM1_08049 [Bipolaris maydis]